MKNKIIFASLLFFATFFYGLVWAAIVPAENEAPDEGAHTEMIYFLKTEKRIPIFNRESKLSALKFDNSQLSGAYYSMAYISPLNYLPFLLTFNSDLLQYQKTDVLASRTINSLFLGLFAVFLFLALSGIQPKKLEQSVLITLFFTFIPQIIFSAGYINVEPIGLFFSSLTFYLLIRVKNKQSLINFLSLGISLGFLALCKTNYLVLIVAFLPIAVFWLFFDSQDNCHLERSREIFLRRKIINLLSLVLPFLIIPSWWWIRNFRLYHDPLIMTYIEKIIREQSPSWFSPPILHGYNIFSLLFEKNFAKFSYQGLFGVLGGANIFFPTVFYCLFYLFLLVPIVYLVGSVIPAKAGIYEMVTISGSPTKSGMTEKSENVFLVFWLVFIIFAYFFTFVAKNLYDFSPQGRHLFPLIIPLAWLFSLAVDRIKMAWFPILAAIFSIVSSLYGLWLVIDSYYVKGFSYAMAGNSGKISEGFTWCELTVQNYQNLINFIFFENTKFFLPILVMIYFLIFIIALAIMFLSFCHPRLDLPRRQGGSEIH